MVLPSIDSSGCKLITGYCTFNKYLINNFKCPHYKYITNLKTTTTTTTNAIIKSFFTFQTARAAVLYSGCPQCRLAHDASTAHASSEAMGLSTCGINFSPMFSICYYNHYVHIYTRPQIPCTLECI